MGKVTVRHGTAIAHCPDSEHAARLMLVLAGGGSCGAEADKAEAKIEDAFPRLAKSILGHLEEAAGRPFSGLGQALGATRKRFNDGDKAAVKAIRALHDAHCLHRHLTALGEKRWTNDVVFAISRMAPAAEPGSSSASTCSGSEATITVSTAPLDAEPGCQLADVSGGVVPFPCSELSEQLLFAGECAFFGDDSASLQAVDEGHLVCARLAALGAQSLEPCIHMKKLEAELKESRDDAAGPEFFAIGDASDFYMGDLVSEVATQTTDSVGLGCEVAIQADVGHVIVLPPLQSALGLWAEAHVLGEADTLRLQIEFLETKIHALSLESHVITHHAPSSACSKCYAVEPVLQPAFDVASCHASSLEDHKAEETIKLHVAMQATDGASLAALQADLAMQVAPTSSDSPKLPAPQLHSAATLATLAWKCAEAMASSQASGLHVSMGDVALAASHRGALLSADELASDHAAALKVHKGELELQTRVSTAAHAKLHDHEALAASYFKTLQRAEDVVFCVGQCQASALKNHTGQFDLQTSKLADAHVMLIAAHDDYAAFVSACAQGNRVEQSCQQLLP